MQHAAAIAMNVPRATKATIAPQGLRDFATAFEIPQLMGESL
jgi:hypothetical protein